MNTLEIPERGVMVDVPGHWDEMSAKQLQSVLESAFLFCAGQLSYHDFMTRAFYKLAGIRRNWRSVMWERLRTAAQVSEKNENAFILAEQYCSFLLKKNDQDQLEVNYDSVVNRFPILKLKGRIWYGPADLLSDLTFGEFRAAMEEMNDYFRNKDDHSLLRMIACLYRPAPPDPEIGSVASRESLTRSKLDLHAKILKLVPEWQRLAILLWFTWCINYIQTEDLLIEGREISLKVLFPKSEDSFENKGSGAAGLGWTGVLYAIAKEGLFGDIEKTDKAGLFDVLLFMYDNHLQAKRNKK